MRTVSDQSRRVARNFVWLTIQEVVIRLLGLAAAIFLARKFSATDYGALGIALAVVGVLGVVVSAGTGVRATRLTALDPTTIPDTFAVVSGIRLTMALLLYASLVALAPVTAGYLSIPPVLLVLTGLWLWRPALGVDWAFRGQDRMHVIAASEVIEKSVMFLGLLTFVHGGSQDLLRVPLIEAGAALILVYLLYSRLERNFSPLHIRFNVSEWRRFMHESFPVTLASLMGSVHQHGSVLLLGVLLTADSAANFLVSQKIMLTVITVLLVVNNSAFPTISRLMAGRVPQALELQATLLRFFIAVTIPVALLTGFYAPQVLGQLFGKTYGGAGLVLVVLLFALPFTIFARSLQNVLLASANPRPVLLARTCGAVAMLLLLVMLIPKLETPGAALAFVGGELVGMVILMAGAQRNLHSILWNRFTSGTLAAGMVMALSFFLTADWVAPVRVLAAVLLYLGSLFLFRGIRLGELNRLPQLMAAAVRKGT